MAVPAPSARQTGRDRRRWSRYRLDGPLSAELVSDTGRLSCQIEDVSLAGARLRLNAPACPSDDLRLDYGGKTGPSGRCAWIEGDSIGLNFGFSDDALTLTLACIGEPSPKTAGAEGAGAAPGESGSAN